MSEQPQGSFGDDHESVNTTLQTSGYFTPDRTISKDKLEVPAGASVIQVLSVGAHGVEVVPIPEAVSLATPPVEEHPDIKHAPESLTHAVVGPKEPEVNDPPNFTVHLGAATTTMTISSGGKEREVATASGIIGRLAVMRNKDWKVRVIVRCHAKDVELDSIQINSIIDQPLPVTVESYTARLQQICNDISRDRESQDHQVLKEQQQNALAVPTPIGSLVTKPAEAALSSEQEARNDHDRKFAGTSSILQSVGPACSPRPVKKDSTWGSFDALTESRSLQTDPELNHLPMHVRKSQPETTLWKIHELFSNLLPYLLWNDIGNLRLASSSIFNACSEAICFVDFELGKDLKPFRRCFDNQSTYCRRSEEFNLTLVSTVVCIGTIPEEKIRRKAIKSVTAIFRGLQAVVNLDTACRSAVKQQATARLRNLLELLGERIKEKKDPAKLPFFKHTLRVLAATKAPEISLDRARLALAGRSAGVRNLLFVRLAAFDPQIISRGGLSEFQNLQRLSVYDCPLFTLSSFPAQLQSCIIALNAHDRPVAFDWDFIEPQTHEYRQNVRKGRALGGFLFRAFGSEIPHNAPATISDLDFRRRAIAHYLEKYNELNLFVMLFAQEWEGWTRLRRHFNRILRGYLGSEFADVVNAALTEVYAGLNKDPDILTFMFTWVHGRNSYIDPKSNNVQLHWCSECQQQIPGIFFEDAQIRASKRGQVASCLACRYAQQESITLVRTSCDTMSSILDQWIVENEPSSLSDFLNYTHPKIPEVKTWDMALENEKLHPEFAKMCPAALGERRCKVMGGCQMAVPKGYPEHMKMPETKRREHPWIRPFCRKMAAEAICDVTTDEHRQHISHDPDFQSQYERIADKTGRWGGHRAGKLNMPFDPTTSIGTEPPPPPVEDSDRE